MARIWLWRLFVMVGLGLAGAALSGCVLQMAFGNVVVAKDTQWEYDTAIATGATGAFCDVNGSLVSCDFVVDGKKMQGTSYILGPAGNGMVPPIIVDPLILEVPDNVLSVTGTYNTGRGPQPLLIRNTHSFPVEPNHRITAEVNTTFLILSVPASVTDRLPTGSPQAGPPISYTVSFHQLYPLGSTPPPVTVKPLQAGEVTVLWQTYYMPLFPCIYDYVADPFAAIPPVTIPQANSPQDLSPALGNLINQDALSPCHNVVYNYTFARPPANLVFLPLVGR